MDNGQWAKVRREAERQGWVVEPTSDGFVLKAPDGKSQVFMHALHASSDPHALARTARRMRGYGFLWPPPKVAGR